MIFIRDTRTGLVTRVERSHLAFTHQGRYLLKGGGSVTAWPLFIVYPDIRSIEYSYRAFDDHSWLAAWHVSKTRRLRVSTFSPQLYSPSYITPLLIRSRLAPNSYQTLLYIQKACYLHVTLILQKLNPSHGTPVQLVIQRQQAFYIYIARSSNKR